MTDSGPWRIEFAKRAIKDLSRLDKTTQTRIGEAIDGLAGEPPRGDIRRLVGAEPAEFRLRVGDWRVIFDEDQNVVAIISVAPRGSAYE